jgi:gamma-glutamylaminecyclotransferase
MESTSTVFVYGTLRRGGKYHAALHTSRFLGPAWTQARYALYLATYPCVIRQESVARIRGEVYIVDVATLRHLDELEEHPQVYCRAEVPVELDHGPILTAWIYFYPHPTGRLELSGDFAPYL